MTPAVPKLGKPLDGNKKAKNNYLSVARFFGTTFQERKNDPFVPKKVPAGENKTIGNTLQHQNQLTK